MTHQRHPSVTTGSLKGSKVRWLCFLLCLMPYMNIGSALLNVILFTRDLSLQTLRFERLEMGVTILMQL